MPPHGSEFQNFCWCIEQLIWPRRNPASAVALSALPWQFIQLRGKPVTQILEDLKCHSNVQPFEGEVDLLGTAESCLLLTTAALSWCERERCHVRSQFSGSAKRQLTVLSIDGRHKLVLDLWIQLAQIDHGRCRILFQHGEAIAKWNDSAIGRFPVELEAALYLHHLAAKKKDIAADQVQDRLREYEQRAPHDEVRQLAKQVRENCKLSCDALAAARHVIEQFLKPNPFRATPGLLFERLRSALQRPARLRVAAAIVGCDGSGKSSLIGELVRRQPQWFRAVTGKHLYRKSLTYKLAVIVLRPLLFQSRERFDELLAPLLYIRAAVALRWKTWLARLLRSQRTMLIDRCPADFLCINRKTDVPQVRWLWLTFVFGQQVPVIHLQVGHQILARRKSEITETGHAFIDEFVRTHFAFHCPSDYLLFSNNAPLPVAADALERILRSSNAN